jgi:CRP-like cAMP-binding protein
MVAPEILAEIGLFDELGADELGELASWFESKTVAEDVRLIEQGQTGYSFFVLRSGSVVVTAGERTVAELGPGDFFGEMAILGDGRRFASVTSTTPSELLVMFGTEFRRLEQQHPAVAAALEQAMRQRLSELPAAGG